MQLTPSAPPSPHVLATLERHALRRNAILKAVSAGIAYAPTLDDCAASIERARLEFENLEYSAEQYSELGAGNLLALCGPRLARLPTPNSWFEAVLAQLVLRLASATESRSLCGTQAPVSLQRQLAEDDENVAAARAALLELDAGSDGQRFSFQGAIERWLGLALETLEPHARKPYLTALRREAERFGLDLDEQLLAA